MFERSERDTERKREREKARKTRVSRFSRNSRAIASPGTRGFARCGALPIKFRGLTRRRYARSTKADNSIPHRSREEQRKRERKDRRGSMERHGVVFRRGIPRTSSSGHASTGFNLPFSLESTRVLSARLLLPADDAASLGRNDANAVTCIG